MPCLKSSLESEAPMLASGSKNGCCLVSPTGLSTEVGRTWEFEGEEAHKEGVSGACLAGVTLRTPHSIRHRIRHTPHTVSVRRGRRRLLTHPTFNHELAEI
jgi:hypothetical protein